MRSPARIKPMLELLEQLWTENPDQRLGQVVANAGRDPVTGSTRDCFNIEDDEMWDGLRRWAAEFSEERGPR